MKQLIVCLLVVLLGRLPIPWAHCHEVLCADPLQEHLGDYHRGEDDGLPLGGDWHLHLFCFGPDASNPDGFNDGTSAAPLSYLGNQRYRLATGHESAQQQVRPDLLQPVLPSLQTYLQQAAATGWRSLSFSASLRCVNTSLFQLHCALLA